jgi:hypothetical protein
MGSAYANEEDRYRGTHERVRILDTKGHLLIKRADGLFPMQEFISHITNLVETLHMLFIT